ncbi:MAG: DNA gyrase inhibitor YacG [Hyphomicrobiaceae bacterium]|nr:DNA gyrase inhibitor YacG [Hyphomicrobiaceae bacterium]
MAADSNVTRLRPTRPCPICKKPSAQKFHPFCSARCADVDLNRWLSGTYVIAGRDKEDGEDENWGEEDSASAVPDPSED